MFFHIWIRHVSDVRRLHFIRLTGAARIFDSEPEPG